MTGLAALAVAVAGPSTADAYTVTASCDASGVTGSCSTWYTSNVTLRWSWSPDDGSVFSIGQSCVDEVFTSDTRAQRSCQVTWNNGDESDTRQVTVKVDKTPPIVSSATPERKPDENGWYTRPVRFNIAGSDAMSGIASCAPVTYAGPDAAAGSVTGSCTDIAGNTGSASFGLEFDGTPPVVQAVPDRPPDANGWYNHPVAFSFEGTDSVSGVASCTIARYAGPDGASVGVSGTCTDNAGNSDTLQVPLRYDATAPSLKLERVETHRGSATLEWSRSPDTAQVSVTRSPGRAGAASSGVFAGNASHFTDTDVRTGTEYSYTLTASDAAGNSTVLSVSVIPGVAAVLRPGVAAWVTDPPLLRWTRAPGATYYNVQLFRLGGSTRGRVVAAARSRKVLSSWPRRPQLMLHRSWTYGGRRRQLSPGTYKWFVWPGHGRLAAHRYGRLLGSGTFRVVR